MLGSFEQSICRRRRARAFGAGWRGRVFSVFSLATLAAFGYRAASGLLTALVLLMFLVSLWLIYLQAFVIHAFCQFCLLSAAVTTALTVIVLFARRTR